MGGKDKKLTTKGKGKETKGAKGFLSCHPVSRLVLSDMRGALFATWQSPLLSEPQMVADRSDCTDKTACRL